MARRITPLSERLWSRVRKLGLNDCWEWVGPTTQAGYGKLGAGLRGGKILLAHRVAFEDTYGSIPSGLCVLHRCDNRPCVNPTHLWLGTKRDNLLDAIAKGHWTPYHPCYGMRNGAKLSEDQVREIRSQPSQVSQVELARLYGVVQQTISCIVGRRSWTDIE